MDDMYRMHGCRSTSIRQMGSGYQYLIFVALPARAAGALLTAAAGPTPRAVFAFLIGAQALFGFGCGGEFPVAAASASERAESEAHLKGLRGRTTVLVFSMQARQPSSAACVMGFNWCSGGGATLCSFFCCRGGLWRSAGLIRPVWTHCFVV